MAKVINRYVDGVGIRIMMDAVSQHGEGHQFVRNFADFCEVPVIGMADDRVHPCQGLADIMGWSERYSLDANPETLKGKTLLLTWGSSGLARPLASVQSHLLLAARIGMNIKLAYPEGYRLETEICEKARAYCKKNGASYEELHDPESGYHDTHVVYVRNWISPRAYQNGEFQYQNEIDLSLGLKEWIVTEEKMSRTQGAIFANSMPIERNREAEDDVVDSKYSIIYDVAENRKHIQKALLASILGNVI